MAGFWEILLILLILGTVVWPWYQRRQAAKRATRQPSTPPQAREVDYEAASDAHDDRPKIED